MTRTVYMVDLNAERALKLQQRLEAQQAVARHFPLLKDCLIAMKSQACQLLLVHSEALAELKVGETLFSLCKTVVYGEEVDALERETWYAWGAYQVVSSSVDLVERTAQVVEKYWYRRETFPAVQKKRLTLSPVASLPLAEVFYNAMMERKNLIVKASIGPWEAQGRFYLGHLVEAETPELTGSAAALKLLHLPNGFVLVRRCQFENPPRINLPSTLGLLAENHAEAHRLQQLIRRLGWRNPRFILSPSLEQEALEPDQQVLLKSLQQYPCLQDVLLYVPLPPLAALNGLEQFLERGWIALEQPNAEPDDWEAPDIDYLQRTLFRGGKKEANLVVLGLPDARTAELIKTLCGRRRVQEKTVHSLHIVRVALQAHVFLNVIGITLTENFMQLMEKLGRSLAAWILLIGNTDSKSLEYNQYLIQQFVQQTAAPMAVGLTCRKGMLPFNEQGNLRSALRLPEPVEIIPVRPDSFASVRQLLYNLNSAKPAG